jgi:hypothetical protein
MFGTIDFSSAKQSGAQNQLSPFFKLLFSYLLGSTIHHGMKEMQVED